MTPTQSQGPTQAGAAAQPVPTRGSPHLVLYEVHRCLAGKWELDSTYDDRDLALEVAHRLRQDGRYRGVRVLKEWYDEGTGRLNDQVIFMDVDRKPPPARQEPPRRAQQPAEEPAEKPAKKPVEKRPAAAPPKRSRLEEPVYLGLVLCGILLLGVTAIIGLRQLAALL